tara:strand:- start:254 stop:586 length:333 start_codon:yes stop_codon:yes gene_type:complete
MLKFNPHRDIRIDRVKSHHTYLKPPKDPLVHRAIEYKTPRSEVPWEIRNITNLTAGKPKKKLDMNTVFDLQCDGKTKKVKKESKAFKLKRAYVMCNDKKFHEINGKFKPM